MHAKRENHNEATIEICMFPTITIGTSQYVQFRRIVIHQPFVYH